MRFLRPSGKQSVARLLLAVMMATLLSPLLGWHMQAEHHEFAAGPASPDHHHPAGDDHSGTDNHGDAHASIGHLLGHMPMQLSRFELFIPMLERLAPRDESVAPRIVAGTSPPYRPPLHIRLS